MHDEETCVRNVNGLVGWLMYWVLGGLTAGSRCPEVGRHEG